MKSLSALLCRVGSSLCLLAPLSALAEAPQPNASEVVAKHLETGGVFYTLVDIDGDLAKFATVGDSLLELAKKQAGGALPPGLTTTGILQALGLDRLKAFGMSSKATTGNLFHNRGLLYLPEGRSGIFKLLGGAAAPFQSPALAPAGSDLVIESELTLSSLLEMAEAVLRSTGDEAMLQQYRAALGFPMPGGMEMTAGDFIAKLDTRIIIAGRLEKDQSYTPPGEKFTVPGFRLVVSLDRMAFLAKPLLAYAKSSEDCLVEEGEGFQLVKPKIVAPNQPPFIQPLLYHDIKNQRLLFATHPDALAEFLATKTPLSADTTFQQAIINLPKEGNELTYVTPAFYQAIRLFVDQAIQAAPVTPGGPDTAAIKQFFGFIEELSPTPTQPIVSLRANLPEGMLFLSNSTSSYKAILTIPAALVTGMIGAVGTGAYQGFIHGANNQSVEAEATTEADPAPEESDDPNQAVRNNLQQILFAARSYFVDHPKATQVSYEQLIQSELLFRLEPANGESYKGLKLKKAGGTLSLKIPGSAEPLTQPYGPTTD